MAMKKKFLGLAMAAAVALPAASVYADTVIWDDLNGASKAHSVTVKGLVSKTDGTAPNGKLQVELPTTLTFMVDKQGQVAPVDFEVKNTCDQAIAVSVSRFTEGNDNDGINITTEDQITSQSTRADVSLKLTGDQTSLDLAEAKTVDKSDTKLLVVNPMQTESLTLTGKAGTQPIANGKDAQGVDESFNLVFKLTKN